MSQNDDIHSPKLPSPEQTVPLTGVPADDGCLRKDIGAGRQDVETDDSANELCLPGCSRSTGLDASASVELAVNGVGCAEGSSFIKDDPDGWTQVSVYNSETGTSITKVTTSKKVGNGPNKMLADDGVNQDRGQDVVEDTRREMAGQNGNGNIDREVSRGYKAGSDAVRVLAPEGNWIGYNPIRNTPTVMSDDGGTAKRNFNGQGNRVDGTSGRHSEHDISDSCNFAGKSDRFASELDEPGFEEEEKMMFIDDQEPLTDSHVDGTSDDREDARFLDKSTADDAKNPHRNNSAEQKSSAEMSNSEKQISSMEWIDSTGQSSYLEQSDDMTWNSERGQRGGELCDMHSHQHEDCAVDCLKTIDSVESKPSSDAGYGTRMGDSRSKSSPGPLRLTAVQKSNVQPEASAFPANTSSFFAARLSPSASANNSSGRSNVDNLFGISALESQAHGDDRLIARSGDRSFFITNWPESPLQRHGGREDHSTASSVNSQPPIEGHGRPFETEGSIEEKSTELRSGLMMTNGHAGCMSFGGIDDVAHAAPSEKMRTMQSRKERKTKRQTEGTIEAGQITGNRGNLTIEELMDFINSDKSDSKRNQKAKKRSDEVRSDSWKTTKRLNENWTDVKQLKKELHKNQSNFEKSRMHSEENQSNSDQPRKHSDENQSNEEEPKKEFDYDLSNSETHVKKNPSNLKKLPDESQSDLELLKKDSDEKQSNSQNLKKQPLDSKSVLQKVKKQSVVQMNKVTEKQHPIQQHPIQQHPTDDKLSSFPVSRNRMTVNGFVASGHTSEEGQVSMNGADATETEIPERNGFLVTPSPMEPSGGTGVSVVEPLSASDAETRETEFVVVKKKKVPTATLR